jgi:drug/metabolite transporter (DMT)-like permease
VSSLLSFALAVLAACANAAANVLQRKANKDKPPELSMRLRLVLDLLRDARWLAAVGLITVSFVFLATALSMGRLAAVQPVVVMELPLTLIGASLVLGARLGAREWVASAAMSAGLAGLITSLAPSAGNNGAAPGTDWAVSSALSVALLGAVALLGIRAGTGTRRAALLGVATGMTFGLTAAFMKGSTAGYHRDGVVGAVTSWQTYAMVVAGLVGMYLMQNAVHAGRLVVAQPGITLADPVVAIVWGVVVFRESPRTGPVIVAAVVSAAVLAAGAVVLARSPLLSGAGGTEEERDEGAAHEAGVGRSGEHRKAS